MGGEEEKFKDKNTFDATFASIANGIRGRYLLSSSPNSQLLARIRSECACATREKTCSSRHDPSTGN